MKMTKIISLLLVLLMTVGIFASCGDKNSNASFGDCLNTEYNTHSNVVKSLSLVQDLEGYSVKDSNKEFVILEKLDTDGTDSLISTYKIVAVRTGRILNTFSNTVNITTNALEITTHSTEYNFKLFDGVPAIKVIKSDTVTVIGKPTEHTVNYSLYDATGAYVISQETDFELTATFNDWAIFDDVVYTVNNETGALTRKSSTPVNFSNINTFIANDTYIYANNGDDIIVYDKDFKVVAVWSTPANSTIRIWFVLNDGNIFIQYNKVLDPSEKKYDYYVGDTMLSMEKFDLCTEIYNVEDKKSKDINFEYTVDTGASRYSLNKAADGKDIFASDAFENVVEVHSIIDKKLDTSDARKDFLVIDNNGNVKSSLKLAEYQTKLPVKISDDKYLVQTLYGTAITDAKGNVLTQYKKSNFDQVGDYFVDTKRKYGIYDMSFNVVYDFSENNNAIVYDIMDDTIFVKEFTDEKKENYKIIGFTNGKRFDVLTYEDDEKNNLKLNIIKEAGIYSLYDSETKEYTYYNADGTKLMTNIALISSVIAKNDNICILAGTKDVTQVNNMQISVVVYYIAEY